ncbi:GGDEF domain-containing protein [Archangium gephyra]|uniref:GGDEF domain-containing protein n=1 Tax=Archangium gephyra TaxID=48 RepID=UPI003B78344C
MKITRAIVIEPGAAGRRKLKEGLEKAGLEVSAVAGWEEAPGRGAQVVVLGPSVERPARVARAVRGQLPQALVLAAQETPGKAGFADGVLPLPVSGKDLRVRLPELVKLRTLSRGTPVRKARAAPAEPVRATGEPLLDPLTQFYVFAHFKDFVFVEVKRSRRHGLPLALALVAFDPLPVRAGRELREQLHGGLALAIRRSLRDTDFPVQYSADRVLLLLPHTDLAGAHTLARRVCERVSRSSLAFDDQVVRPTVSVGLAALTPGREVSFADLVRQAQSSLESAQAAGGNRVEMLAETPGLEIEGT